MASIGPEFRCLAKGGATEERRFWSAAQQLLSLNQMRHLVRRSTTRHMQLPLVVVSPPTHGQTRRAPVNTRYMLLLAYLQGFGIEIADSRGVQSVIRTRTYAPARFDIMRCDFA